MKNILSFLLLALVATTGWAQKKVWNDIVTGYASAPIIKVTKVAFYDDRTEAVKEATVIKLNEPYAIPADGKVDFSLVFEPIQANTWMIDVAEPNAWSIANIRDADSQPTGIADTYWRIEATGDWLIGFAKQHVIYNNKVLDIVSQIEKKDAYTLTLNDGTTIHVGKIKNGLRQIAIGKNKAIVCSPITGAALPDYPTKDQRQLTV